MNIDDKWAKRKQAEEYRRKKARRAREKRQAADPEYQKRKAERARQDAEQDRAWEEERARRARDYAKPITDRLMPNEALKLLSLNPPSKAMVDYAYKTMMFLHHPDRGGSVEMAVKINAARERLYFDNNWE